MNDIDEIKASLTQHKVELENKYKVKKLGIFGSYARGEQSKDSDIDILVEFESPIGLEFIDLADELEKILNKKIDLVSANAIKPRLKKYILQDITYV